MTELEKKWQGFDKNLYIQSGGKKGNPPMIEQQKTNEKNSLKRAKNTSEKKKKIYIDEVTEENLKKYQNAMKVIMLNRLYMQILKHNSCQIISFRQAILICAKVTRTSIQDKNNKYREPLYRYFNAESQKINNAYKAIKKQLEVIKNSEFVIENISKNDVLLIKNSFDIENLTKFIFLNWIVEPFYVTKKTMLLKLEQISILMPNLVFYIDKLKNIAEEINNSRIKK